MRLAPVFVLALAALLVADAASNCPNNCNDHGSCEQPDKSHSSSWCNCNSGWSGSSCGMLSFLFLVLQHRCFFFSFSFFIFLVLIDTQSGGNGGNGSNGGNGGCPSNCNNHGSCEQPDKSHSSSWCNCNSGWSGSSCGMLSFLFLVLLLS